MKKSSYSGITRTSSGRLRRLSDQTSPTLKRSFEVEEVDQSSNSSTPQRRAPNTLLRSTVSSSTQKFQELGARNSEPSARHAEPTVQRSPKPPLRRVELSGPKLPEPVSRRTEISIDISSKQVENSSSGLSRFGLKRADVGHKPPEPAARRTEITLGKPQEPGLRRAEAPASKIPELPQRRAEPANAAAPDAAPRRLDIQVAKAAEATRPVESSEPAQPQQAEPKAQPLPVESPPKREEGPEAVPSHAPGMTDAPRDAGPKQAAPARPDKPAADFGYVGIDAILEQLRRKAMKQGFEFNIMVVGQSGLGKSTLINTLFKSKISRKSVQPTAEERIPKTIEIKSITHEIEEKGVRMKLTVIDTPGFGDHINNENCWQPIMKFINDQYEKYLQEEININRKKRIPDTRVHCCIYFIPATGHSLRPLDIEFMKRLSKVVNIVPVIAKADTLTLEERDYFKQRIMADLLANGIDVYPQKEFDEDSEDRLVNEKFREMIPFAVVGSDQEYQVNGRRILGRKTKWGTIEVENTTHCEFAYLRDLLIRTHMQNIKDITSNIHFEAYRVKRLNEGQSSLSNGVADKELVANEM
ncbi:septin-9 isoform X1 [Poecile atricapillus]|uniref:septin-9 isoform X1 n=2 Tax=Poecile atricapillus TaxID=48891 RepID=UPI002739B8B8|nr:septin-9 isoform X1 [Poecile atricapillus]XP_058708441.1 septin-9 isoform X1 [Poecile atricapillus]XP_058708442.1 septin-9 isoform X1 [Poecile atricapillus]XP_058708443.1 septin-9 isoform X1 [Poecile atricapillus]XP_058708447.1 septin-9 isoform X1 [Poecile atricapillus]XP_058708448.1 septin-9 isoform X1 [Poecile atricapillus]